MLLVCWDLVWRGWFGGCSCYGPVTAGVWFGVVGSMVWMGVIHVLITVLVVFRRWLFEYVVCGLI